MGSAMAREILDSRVIGDTTKVWYIAVAGDETLDGAMTNLHEFGARIERDHIWGAIIDLRRLSAYPPAPDWTSFCNRVRMKMPFGMRIAVLAASHLPQAPLREFVKAGQDGGGAMKAFKSWGDAVSAVRLPVETQDPLGEPQEVYLLD